MTQTDTTAPDTSEPGFITVPLSKEIDVMGEKVKKLRLRTDLTADDLRCMDEEKGIVGKTIALIAHMANVPPSSVGKVSSRDFTKLQGIATPFIA